MSENERKFTAVLDNALKKMSEASRTVSSSYEVTRSSSGEIMVQRSTANAWGEGNNPIDLPLRKVG